MEVFVKHFKIYSHSQEKNKAIKQGFSYPALIFTPIWAIVKGMWVAGTIILFLTLARYTFLILFAKHYPFIDQILDLPLLIISLVFGFKGNKWWESILTSRGFVLVDSIEAINQEQAINQYNYKLHEKYALTNQ